MAAGRATRAVLAAALTALAACADLGAGRPMPERPVTPTPPPPTELSLSMQAYYQRVERTLVSQGLLRTDGGGPDTPFNADDLAEDFMVTALYDELVAERGRYVARASPSELRRWGGPVRMQVFFGPSVPQARQQADLQMVDDYTRRLSQLTGVPIRIATSGPSYSGPSNFDVLFLSEDERLASAATLRTLVPGISTTAVNTIIAMPRDTYCMVFAFSEDPSPVYTRALAVIRSEHPDRLRQACIHEELAQAMGLPNDSRARPSIFNDDEEFALLTRHDELLLRILYDPRLRPGLTAPEARPIVEAIARELMGGES